jgi:Flavin containing amine oxidoreductase
MHGRPMRPQWRTPLRRSRDYVAAVLEDLAAHGAAVHLETPVVAVKRSAAGARVVVRGGGEDAFDHVVFACHAPTVLELLGDGATAEERRILGAFRYAENLSYVHTDERLMPAAKGAWSAWNFVSRRGAEADAAARGAGGSENRPVCVSYWLNKLQNLNRGAAGMPELFETLNPCVPIDPRKVLSEARFWHPQFTEESVRAQEDLQNVIQGENRSWFCGAYARYGFHEDGLMTGLDVAERLSGYKVLRPWRSKERMAINNNYRRYDVPFASPRSLGIVYLGGLFVVNLVGARIHAGLSTLSKRLSPDEPSVVLSVGGGTLLRFGHATAASSKPGLVNIRSPQLLARVTDAIRHHRDLVPVAVASFLAGEIDCPLPSDLTAMLHALIIAQRKGPEVGHGLQGQMHLAESLLHAIVGGFEEVTPPSSVGRVPELTTAVFSVLAPCWWLSDTLEAGERGMASGGSSAASSGSKGVKILELGGDLSAHTVSKLQSFPTWHATVVVTSPDRVQHMESKAKLLKVQEQTRVLPMDAFRAEKGEGTLGVFDHVISPAVLNFCEQGGLFSSLAQFMQTLWQLLSDGPEARAELGFTACDDLHARKEDHYRAAADAMYCGDPGYRLQPLQAVMDAANATGFRLESFSQMPAGAAAAAVEATLQRTFSCVASENMTNIEIRRAVGQFCLWQAALIAGIASRSVVILRRPTPSVTT